ncbi:MAG TPA: site-specific DNA-methyltransferase [Candidatus Acidoferrum sp.]|jgi:DNA modification methylase|nr:site-specific DNA-methyltransferase [Candidatus Acidoferrum sp.]
MKKNAPELQAKVPDQNGTSAGYTTPLGSMYCGSCEDVLARPEIQKLHGKIQLIFTSPPFPLNRKKSYGNMNGQKYIEWLAGLAPTLTKFLTPNGSIVIELGNAWEKGKPTMSTLSLEALLAFKAKANLHLCQEFICFNPARLPTPAQWVNVERIRVKDAFTRLWWLSPTEKPKADNKRILREYSDSMKELLKKRTYNAGHRPSQHRIGAKSFLTNNRGAIPPNVFFDAEILYNFLVMANTSTNDPYQIHCRDHELKPHPARMPVHLAEFFINFLTEPSDRVMDPFAGSNTTGDAAERLWRRWMSIEAKPEYVNASKSRFAENPTANAPDLTLALT